jgi:hypothetical protein
MDKPYAGICIDESEVEGYREMGCRIHHEYQTETVWYDFEDAEDPDECFDTIIVSDSWYAADPDWVDNYLRSGGTWGYVD